MIRFDAGHPDQRLIDVYQVLDSTPNAVITLSRTGIKTPADLDGRKIGAPAADSSRLMFAIFARLIHEVAAPPDEVWLQLFDHLRQTDPPCPARHVPDLRLIAKFQICSASTFVNKLQFGRALPSYMKAIGLGPRR
jgi:NMT1/THI5 like